MGPLKVPTNFTDTPSSCTLLQTSTNYWRSLGISSCPVAKLKLHHRGIIPVSHLNTEFPVAPLPLRPTIEREAPNTCLALGKVYQPCKHHTARRKQLASPPNTPETTLTAVAGDGARAGGKRGTVISQPAQRRFACKKTNHMETIFQPLPKHRLGSCRHRDEGCTILPFSGFQITDRIAQPRFARACLKSRGQKKPRSRIKKQRGGEDVSRFLPPPKPLLAISIGHTDQKAAASQRLARHSLQPRQVQLNTCETNTALFIPRARGGCASVCG